MNLYFHPDAEIELTEASLYYMDARPGLGESFISEVVYAAELIAGRPLLGVLVAGGNIRRIALRRFPYSLIYSVLSDRIRILAVSHQKRQPLHWRGRQ